MAHIHTQPGQHDLTVSAYIFRLDPDEPKVILHRHKKHQNYLQFGGHVELSENPWQAVLRELEEESGYWPEQIQVLQPPQHIKGARFTHPHPLCILTYPAGDKHKHTDICFAFTTNENPKSIIGRDESNDIISLTQHEFEALSKDEMFENARDVITFIFQVALTEWKPQKITDM